MRRLRILVISLMALLTMMVSPISAMGATAESEALALSTLREIRAAHQPGYDRLVFEFSGDLPEFTRARWVDRVIEDGSGLPVRVAGNAFLQITMFNVRAHTSTGATTYGPARRAYDLPNIATVVNSGDFEATVSFGVGLMKRTTIVRTLRLTNPSRFVVDVGTNFTRTRVNTYFLDEQRFVDNTPPFFRPVRRSVPVPGVARGALHRLYAGPTQAERANNLTLLRSGSTGFTNLSISDSEVARVQLKGGCNSGGSTVTVAGEIMPTLRQFPTVSWVKIYDPQGNTQNPTGLSDSIPACLEP